MFLIKQLKRFGFIVALVSFHSSLLMAATLSDFPKTTIEISEQKNTSTLDYSRYITRPQWVLPRNFYVLNGTLEAPESLNIFYENAFLSLTDAYNLQASSTYGQKLPERWLLQTPVFPLSTPSTPFTVDFSAQMPSGEVQGSTNVEIVTKDNLNPVRLLPIGDSFTRAGVYLKQVMKRIPNVSTLGTRYYPEDSMPVREGRGGWTLSKYTTAIHSDELDSPFVFPTTVSGTHYKGNTRDWKAICYDSPTHAVYNGFQKIARGWQDFGDYLYDENGYYKFPTFGDVMVDPTLPYGKQWVMWNGFNWSPMTKQPQQFEFNFSKYMERFSVAFESGTPTHVSILLGANEFGFGKQLDSISTFIEQLNSVIYSIHAYDPTIKIILCTPTVAPDSERITSTNQSFYKEYDLCIKYLSMKLMEAFDNDLSIARHIYIAPMHLTLDPINGYNYIQKTEQINGFPTLVTDVDNSIHPSNQYGQLQMGNTLAAIIQKSR